MKKPFTVLRTKLGFLHTIAETLRSNVGRITSTLVLSLLFFGIFTWVDVHYMEKVPEFFFHISAELLGAIIILLLLDSKLVELTQLKLTGLSETTELPFDGPNNIYDKISHSQDKIIFFDTYLYNLMLVNGRYDLLYQSIKKALINNVEIVILLVNPDSEHATLRAKEINPTDPESVLSEINKCKRKLWALKEDLLDEKELKAKRESNLSINYHNYAPPFSMYCIDSEVYFSFYRPESKSTEQPQLYIPTGTKLIAQTLFTFLHNKFKELLSESVPIDKIIKKG